MSKWIQSRKPGTTLEAYIPPGPIENESKCSRFWKFLSKVFDHHEEAYTVTDLQEKRITHLHGVKTWLGHEEPMVDGPEPVPLNYLSQHVHPLLRGWYELFLHSAILHFTEINTEYLVSRIVISIPLWHATQGYVLVKQMVMPFGRTLEGKIVSLVNSYTIFGPYRNEPMRMKFYKGAEEEEKPMYAAVEARIGKAIRLVKGHPKMTPKYSEILGIMRGLYLKGIEPTAELIAQERLGDEARLDAEKIKSMNEDLRDMKERLNNFLQVRVLLKKVPSADLAHFLEYGDAVAVISFYEQSGIARLIDGYKGR
ncbi:MAG TPA: hypothetical protein VGS79_02990 [Puia sp.]|nr:hypothetical protein [Puia sp.]